MSLSFHTKKIIYYLLLLSVQISCLFFLIIYCTPSPLLNTADGRALLLTDTTIIADLARAVVDDKKVKVVSLLHRYADPHSSILGLQHMLQIEQAQLLLYSGHHLYPPLEEFVDRCRQKERHYCVSNAIDQKQLIREGQIVDPHWWTDLQNSIAVVDHIISIMKQKGCLDVSKAASYRADLQRQLQHVEQQIEKAIAKGEKLIIITSHDAFSYLTHFGFEVYSLQGISPNQPMSPREQQLLLEIMSQHPNKKKEWILFSEESVPKATLFKMLELAKKKNLIVRQSDIDLPSDGLGSRSSYQDMMDFLFEQFIPGYTSYFASST